MLCIDTPTRDEIERPNSVRSDGCVFIYFSSAPATQDVGRHRTRPDRAARTAIGILNEPGFNKGRVWPSEVQFDPLLQEDDSRLHQAHSLAFVVTPDRPLTFRLANGRTEPQVPGPPKDAANAVGKATTNDRARRKRTGGLAGQKLRQGQHTSKFDTALRRVLVGPDRPVMRGPTLPVAGVFRMIWTRAFVVALSNKRAKCRSTLMPSRIATASLTRLPVGYREPADGCGLRARVTSRTSNPLTAILRYQL